MSVIVEQLEKDIEASQQGIRDAIAGTEKIRKELAKLQKEVNSIDVRHPSILPS